MWVMGTSGMICGHKTGTLTIVRASAHASNTWSGIRWVSPCSRRLAGSRREGTAGIGLSWAPVQEAAGQRTLTRRRRINRSGERSIDFITDEDVPMEDRVPTRSAWMMDRAPRFATIRASAIPGTWCSQGHGNATRHCVVPLVAGANFGEGSGGLEPGACPACIP